MSWIYELTIPELRSELKVLKQKDFVLDQVLQWLYGKGNRNIDEWSNLSKENRNILKKKFDVHLNNIVDYKEDDEGTTKFLIQLKDQNKIETVLIKEKKHYTFCLSSQVGCPLKCTFCATGKMGFIRNLSMGEILSQVLLLKEEIAFYKGKINIVFMGMGEPLLNYENLKRALSIITSEKGFGISPRHITVSTAGILRKIKELEKSFPNIKISFSLNAPDAILRDKLMPVSKTEKLNEILDYFRISKRKNRITFEYVLLEGVNSSDGNASDIAKLLYGISCKINLIPYNTVPGLSFKSPLKCDINRFAEILNAKGFTVIVRWSKGNKINSACGQLYTALRSGNTL